MNSNTYVVIGSNGQLGSELKELSASNPASFKFYDYPDIDITKKENLLAILKQDAPAAIINCAAYTAVDKAESESDLAMAVNGDGVKNLAEVAEAIDAWLIHVSTDYVFDGSAHRPYVETDATNPCSAYGRTKLAGENFATAYRKGVVVRTAWLYSSFGANFVKTMLRLGAERDSLNVVFDQVGTPTYARDLASALLAIADNATSSNNLSLAGIYHYSNEGVCSWYDFTREIFDLCNISCKVLPIESSSYPTPAKRPHYSVFNKAKIKATFQIEIPHWKHSLINCLNKLNK
jgi:dTDP-4-dehydrorhamnose reductase